MATVEKLLTAEQFRRLPDNGQLQELVRGKVEEMPPPKFRHGVVCGNIFYLIRTHADANHLGRVLPNDSGVVTERNPDTVRGPDVSFYSFDRIPKGQEPEGYPDVAPELVFEVLSPDDRWPQMQIKVGEYLAAGVNVVCVVDPDAETATVYRADQAPVTLSREQELALGNVLGEFRVTVRQFFA